jgi:carboxypeptidase family protein
MSGIRRVLLVCAILALPAVAYAQEATLNGTVTDSTGGVLPGVTVTAVNEATGNTFTAVTDTGGRYRIPVRTGTYKITVELTGFATVTRSGVQLLAGQAITVDVPLSPGVAETVNVTGETPLVNTTTSSLGGNVDPRQVAELPVAGRNFMSLALLAPGSRTQATNALQPLPDRGRAGDVREFQINVDGQQVSRDMGTGTQPRYSNDMISEFQYIANRFDATMGRSSGVQVNIISKSGTNQFSGIGRVNYRSSKFSAEEPVLKKVLPIDNLQLSTAIGGPVVKDKLHYFGNLEYEREPTESVWNTAYPSFNITLDGINNQKKGGGRLDYELNANTRLMVKSAKSTLYNPFGPGSTNHPSSTNNNYEYNTENYVRLTKVLSNKVVNDLEGGRAVYGLKQAGLTSWTNHWQASNGVTNGSPRIRFSTIGFLPNQNLPRHQDQWYYSVKDNLTYSYDLAGRHDVRMGGEYLHRSQIQDNMRTAGGEIDARGGPTPANVEQLFPVWNNVDTWNLAAISSITRTYQVGTGDFNNWVYSHKVAGWYQDDWRVSEKLTLNVGVRWDADIGAFAQIDFLPWEKPQNYNQWNNYQPRLGFAYKLNEQTVIRGGGGLYIAGATAGDATNAKGNAQIALLTYTNDGRPDFALNPTNGAPLPTFQQAQSQYCHVNNNAKGCIQLAALELVLDPKYEKLAHNWQSSIGIQRQLGETLGIEADYIYTKANHEKGIVDNINLTYDPATGVNFKFTDRTHRLEPNWNSVSASVHLGRSETQEFRTSFTKRFAQHWQASGTYSLRYFWDAEPPPFSGRDPVPFPTAIDLGGEWGLGAGDQRHRATFSGIWEVTHGLQLSVLQYVGSGTRLATTWGTDLRDIQGNGGTQRLRPDGTIIPRNGLVGPAQSRTDLRLQQKIPLFGRMKVDGIAEVFNLFNRPNYVVGTQENQPQFYNQPVNGEYRTAQVGFRLSF